MAALLVLSFVGDLAVAMPAQRPDADVVRVYIESRWLGAGRRRNFCSDLTRQGDAFTDGTTTVDAALVASVVAEMRAASVRSLADNRDLHDELRGWLAAHYRARWSDDHPLVAVMVTFRSGRVASASASDPHDFMLPWRVDGVTTWNAWLANAVSKLLPPGAPNRARLAGPMTQTFVGPLTISSSSRP